MRMVFLESSTFEDYGGWTLDTQCQHTSQLPYLMAHGMGQPVEDASKTFDTDREGTWQVLAFTRDWTAAWHRGRPAGRFEVVVDGVALEQTLGTRGESWNWQRAGAITLPAGTHRLQLHDLTGFNGRCGAVLLADALPEPEALEPHHVISLRDQLSHKSIVDDATVYDLIVCGGGYAGICTALSALRKGLTVLLIQDRPVLGGCGSSEVRVWAGGNVCQGPYPALGAIAASISPISGVPGMKKDKERFEDMRKQMLFAQGRNLLLNEMLVGVEREDKDHPQRITAVLTRALRTGVTTRRRAHLFADCTGDAVLAAMADCTLMYGREAAAEFGEDLAPEKADRLVMGHSTLWETKEHEHPVEFPDIDWGIPFDDSTALARFDCCWDWETGQLRDMNRDIETIRDYGLMTCLANWSFLKNHSQRREQWKHWELCWLSPIGGKREGYRVCGDWVLSQRDVEEGRVYEDGTGCISWDIDLHYPDPENQKVFGEAFQSCAYHRGFEKPYPVPYRCLYARDADNLFLGGRCISATHVAFASVRVMRTLGMLGEVVGLAAAVCRNHDCTPRQVYTDYLEDLKQSMRQGAGASLPCAWGTGVHERYHFMRPVGRFGNPTENCWIDFTDEGGPTAPIPPELERAVDELNQVHRNGKTWRETREG